MVDTAGGYDFDKVSFSSSWERHNFSILKKKKSTNPVKRIDSA